MEKTIIDKEKVCEVLHGFGIDFAKVMINLIKSKGSNSGFPAKRIIPKDPSSPMIWPIPKEQNKFILLYPKNSTPYTFELSDLKKTCYIAIGEIFERECNSHYKEGDYMEVPPGLPYTPYTKDSICIAYVEVDSENEDYKLN